MAEGDRWAQEKERLAQEIYKDALKNQTTIPTRAGCKLIAEAAWQAADEFENVRKAKR